MDQKGIGRVDLAARLGVTRSRVTYLLSARSNMTVTTLGRIFEALGEVPEVTSPGLRDILVRNDG